MLRRALWVLTTVLATSAASAQPSFSVTPTTLGLPPSWGGDSTLEVANLDADTLSVTFPVMDGVYPYYLYGTTIGGILWRVEAETPDSVYAEFSLPHDYWDQTPPPVIRVAPGGAAAVRVLDLYTCPYCRPSQSARPDTLYDVLHLRVADESGADTVRVPFEPIYVVPNEPGPEPQALAVRLAPNPATGTTVVSVEAERTEAADVTVFDALGRVVRRHEQPTGTAVPLDLRALPPGVYVVRARVVGRGAATERLVVTR